MWWCRLSSCLLFFVLFFVVWECWVDGGLFGIVVCSVDVRLCCDCGLCGLKFCGRCICVWVVLLIVWVCWCW